MLLWSGRKHRYTQTQAGANNYRNTFRKCLLSNWQQLSSTLFLSPCKAISLLQAKFPGARQPTGCRKPRWQHFRAGCHGFAALVSLESPFFCPCVFFWLEVWLGGERTFVLLPCTQGHRPTGYARRMVWFNQCNTLILSNSEAFPMVWDHAHE